MVFLWFSYGFPMVFLWFSMVFLWFSMVFLWFSYGFPMVFYGFPMVFLWFSLFLAAEVRGPGSLLRPLGSDEGAQHRPARGLERGGRGERHAEAPVMSKAPVFLPVFSLIIWIYGYIHII